MKKISEAVQVASIGKRVGGFLLDFGITFVLYLVVLYSLGANVLTEAFGAKQDTTNYFSYVTDSGLFEYGDDKKMSVQVIGTNVMNRSSDANNPPSLYKDSYYRAIKNFYCSFLKNDSRVDNREAAGQDYLYTTVFGLPSFDSINGQSLKSDDKKLCGESKYYRYSLNEEGKVDVTLDLSLQDKYQNVIDNGSNGEKAKLINELNSYYYSDTNSLIYRANAILLNQNYYRILSNHSKMANWSIRLICYLPLSFTFFALIPFIRKNGETLGKLVSKTCLANEEGYQVTMKEKAIRCAFMFLLTSLCVIAPISPFYLFFAFAGVCLVDYVLMIVGKDDLRRGIQDRIAKTLVVDKLHSQIFIDSQDEELHFLNQGKVSIPKEEIESDDVVDYDSIQKSREELFLNSEVKAVEVEDKNKD